MLDWIDEDTNEPKLAGLSPQVEIECFLAIEFKCPIGKFPGSELPGCPDDIALFLTEREIHDPPLNMNTIYLHRA